MPRSFDSPLPLVLLLLLLACSAATTWAQSSTGADDSSSSGVDAASLSSSSSATLIESSSSSGAFVFANSTNSTNSTVVASSSSSSSSSSTAVPPPVPSSTGRPGDIIPGGTIGRGDSSFGSTDAIFLTTIRDVWIGVILWTMVCTAFFFFAAGVFAVRVNRTNGCGWKIFVVPPIMLVVGAAVGFTHGAVSAVLIAAITISIPYPVGIDIAAGLGIGHAICITYFHLGRADFIHR